jgi:hypothetical protein
MKELQSWREHKPLPNVDHLSPDLAKAISKQRQFGWKQFLEGLITTEWVKYQDQYYDHIHSNKQGLTWSSKLIKAQVKLLRGSFQLNISWKKDFTTGGESSSPLF